jgi:uncharacterized protein
MATPLDVTSEEMAVYRTTARQRWEKQRHALNARRMDAWETAARAATLLKKQYGVNRVILFGSLARTELFSVHSDIDLIVWGLDEHIYYRAVSQLLDLDPQISIDLVRAEDATASLLEVIKTEGICL